MRKLWQWLSRPRNQGMLAFVFGGLSVVVAGGWQAYLHFFAKPEPPIVANERCLKPPQPLGSEAEAEFVSRVYVIKVAIRDGSQEQRSVDESVAILTRKFPRLSLAVVQRHLLFFGCIEFFSSLELDQDKRTQSFNTFSTHLYPEDNRARLSAVRASTAGDGADTPAAAAELDGRWVGQYFFNGRSAEFGTLEPVDFETELVTDNDKLFGILSEPRTFKYAPTTADRHLAFARGEMTDDVLVHFDKTYIGTAGANHTVRYEGIWDKANGSITGKWNSPHDPGWWGRFIMEKKPQGR